MYSFRPYLIKKFTNCVHAKYLSSFFLYIVIFSQKYWWKFRMFLVIDKIYLNASVWTFSWTCTYIEISIYVKVSKRLQSNNVEENTFRNVRRIFANRKYLKVCRRERLRAAFFDVRSRINSFSVQPLIENIQPLDDIRPGVNTRLTKDPANAIIIAPWNRYNASRGRKTRKRKIVPMEGNMHGNAPKMWRSSGGRASTGE